jgi:hypothetical protein
MAQQGKEGYYGTFQGTPQPVPPSQAPYYNQGGYSQSVPGKSTPSPPIFLPYRLTLWLRVVEVFVEFQFALSFLSFLMWMKISPSSFRRGGCYGRW